MVADSNSKFIVEAINQIGRFEKSNLPRIDDECALKLVNSAIRDVNEYGEKFLYKLYRQLTDNYKLNLINDLRKNKPTIGYPPLKEQLILDYVETLSLYDDYFNNLYESLSRNERRKILSKIKYEKILQGKLPHLTLKILDDALKEGEINPEELRKMKFLNNYRLIHSAIKDFKKPKAIEEDSSQVYNERSKTSGKSKSSIKTSTAKPTKTKNMRKRAKNLKNRETHVELVWVDKLSTPLKNSFQGIKKKDIIITILVSAVIFLTQIGHLWMELLMDELGLFGPELSYVYIYFYWPAFILIFPIIVTLFYGKWNGRILLSFLVGLTPTLLSVIIEELSLLHCSPGFIGLGLFCAGSALQVRDRKKGLILLLSGLGLWVYAFHTGIINWSIDIWPLTSGGEGYLAH
jgi:hypothetical protein